MPLKFQRQPNRWSCAAAAAAMVMNRTVEEVIAKIGHDGSHIWFPDLPEPLCRAGFTLEEIIDAALSFGWFMTPITARPVCTPDGINEREVFTEKYVKNRMDKYLSSYSGVLFGQRHDHLWYHNVAWDHEREMFLDPSGPQLPKEHPPIKIETFWIFNRDVREREA